SYFIVLVLLSLVVISGKPTRKQTNILYFSTQSEDQSTVIKEAVAANNGWNFTQTVDPQIFSEGSLREISAVVVRISDINQLDHRAFPRLKRYLEAGGGGIVAIRDTLLAEKGWPWLSSWFAKEDGSMFNQDKGRLVILGSNPS